MSLNTYEIVRLDLDASPQTSVHRVEAHSAQDAVFEFDFNVCQKSKVMKNGQWVPSSRVDTVRSIDPGE
jgi:hypothetical protein